MRISRIFLHPVKSLRGGQVPSASIDALGIVGDRRFLVVDPAGNFLTQRTVPRMATVFATLEAAPRAGLVLRADVRPAATVPLSGPPPGGLRPALLTVNIWKSEQLLVEDCGDEAAAWLESAIGVPSRLARIGGAFHRPMLAHKLPAALGGHSREVAFTDAYPFMVLGEATLDDLNDRLAKVGHDALPMERFRPSFVIEGSSPYAEDTWKRFRVRGTIFHIASPCARCIVTCTDPWTGDRGHEPLRILATYRRDTKDPTRINFGQNVVHELSMSPASIQVGDAVELLGP